MGVDIAAQGRLLAASALLGMTLALLYDLLRALRLRLRRRRGLADALDAVFCLTSAFSLLIFALRVGDGELRLYTLLTAAAGAWTFFALCSPLLRPLWDFWARVLAELLRLLRLPERKTRLFLARGGKIGKRLFYFWRRSLIISSYQRYALRARRRAARREGVRYGRKGKKTEGAHRAAGGVAGAGAAVSRRVSADEYAAKAGGGVGRAGRAERKRGKAGAGEPLP